MRNYLLLPFLFILTAILALNPFTRYINIVLAVIEIILIYSLFAHNEKRKKEHNNLTISLVRKNVHDYLNCVQVISCYATLNKTDEIIKYIPYINYLAKQIKLISTFSDTELVIYLYELTLEYPGIKIELEIEDEISEIRDRLDGKLVLKTLKGFVENIHKNIDKTKETKLLISMANIDNEFIINLEFEGNIKHVRKKIQSIGRKLIKKNGNINIDLYTEECCSLGLFFPLKKT